MKKFAFAVCLLVIALAGVQAQSDVPVEKPSSVQPGDFISIGPVQERPVLLAEEPSASCETEQPADEKKDEEKQEPDQPKKPQVNFGLMVGIYNPTDDKVKDIFTDNWVRVGIRPLPRDLPQKYRITFDTSYYSMKRGDDKVKLIPITVGILRGFNQGKDVRTYLAFNVGPYYGRVQAPSVGIDERKWLLNSNATAGIIYKDRIALEGRYEFMEKLGGLDFSAFTISASYRVFTARM